ILFDLLNVTNSQVPPIFSRGFKEPIFMTSSEMANRPQDTQWEYEEREIAVGEPLRRGAFSHLFLGSLNGRRVALKLHNPSMVYADDFLKLDHLNLIKPKKFILAKQRSLDHSTIPTFSKRSAFATRDLLSSQGNAFLRLFSSHRYLSGMIIKLQSSLKQYLRQHTLTSTQCLSISHQSTDFALALNLDESSYDITTKEEGFVLFDGILCTQRGTITRAADVWSFAMLMWELYNNGQEPYHRINDQDLHKMLVEDNQRLARPATCPEVIYAKMLECWNIDPEERTNFSDLREFLSYDHSSMLSVFGVRRSTDEEVAVAIGDHTPVDANCGLPFKKGDRFLVRATDSNWWKAKREDTPTVKGKVPSNLVVKEGDVGNYKWISFNTERPHAEKALRDSKYPVGSFIIRSKVAHINDEKHCLALSVKTEKTVIHYVMPKIGVRFRVGDNDGGTLFGNLTLLVNHYAARRKNAALVLTFSVHQNQSVVPWEYDERLITVGVLLDKGHFGMVYSGKLNGELVALKTPNLSIMDEDEFKKEAELARPHKHANVLETIGICRIMNLLYIITEFMANGSLKKYLRNHELSLTECVSVSQKIANAMEYLHRMQIVHRDLAARNVLVGATIDIIKVCDFGLARSLETSRYYITKKETFPHRWTAPEGFVMFDGIIVTEMGRITYSADVWSFGVVMWEVFSNGKEPYSMIEENDLLGLQQMLQEEKKRLDQPSKCPKTIYAKMLECWNDDKHARPTFADLQTFLASIETDDVDLPTAPQLEHSDTDVDSLTSSGGYNQIPHEVVEEAVGEENIIEERIERKVSPAPLMVLHSPDNSGGELVRPTSFNFTLG
uniref:Tyrosine-protein kinase n=1 Tax=Pristionchus pacificus TaxID=54126 RepID=A0A8R1Y747_PRIPA